MRNCNTLWQLLFSDLQRFRWTFLNRFKYG